jgi:hypothetical protein
MLSQKQASVVSFLPQRDKHGKWEKKKSHTAVVSDAVPHGNRSAACGAFGTSQMRLAVEGLDPNAILSKSKRL